jgi:hypothetical protein
MYEVSRRHARLLGVEYIVDAATWLEKHDGPPVLEGQLFQFVSSPNRYGLPAFFELHVWAWRDNPSGTFADWNAGVLRPTLRSGRINARPFATCEAGGLVG